MKPFITITFTCLAFVAHAQTEHWDTYMANYDGRPGSVLVDMGQKERAPDRHLPYIVITGPQAQNCNKEGLPDKDEINYLEDILSATDNFITGVTAKLLVGTFTYNCERLNYYYVKDTMNVRNAIMRMYNRNYKNYRYAINIKYDPEWTTYLTFLYPDEKTKQWMETTAIITGMLEKGDSLKTRRDIDFDLYFRSDTDRQAFASYAQSKGYKTRIPPADPNNKLAENELIVTKHEMVNANIITGAIEELRTEARKHHGMYNGWKTPNP